jgi:23S rRNA U2552 (ribose-2'-O)-methylase RlmE/FtsJ
MLYGNDRSPVCAALTSFLLSQQLAQGFDTVLSDMLQFTSGVNDVELSLELAGTAMNVATGHFFELYGQPYAEQLGFTHTGFLKPGGNLVMKVYEVRELTTIGESDLTGGRPVELYTFTAHLPAAAPLHHLLLQLSGFIGQQQTLNSCCILKGLPPFDGLLLQGSGTQEFIKLMQKHFTKVVRLRVEASRSMSREFYAIGLGRKLLKQDAG